MMGTESTKVLIKQLTWAPEKGHDRVQIKSKLLHPCTRAFSREHSSQMPGFHELPKRCQAFEKLVHDTT